MTSAVDGQNTAWIADRLTELGKRPPALARALGSKRPATVYEILHGKRKIAVEELPAIAEVLEVPLAELVHRLCWLPVPEESFTTEAEAALGKILTSLLEKGFHTLGTREFVNTATVLYRHALMTAEPSRPEPADDNIVDLMKEYSARGGRRA